MATVITKYNPDVYNDEKGIIGVFPEFCKSCGLCLVKCPPKVLYWGSTLGIYGTPIVACKIDGCIHCAICEEICPDCAIRDIPLKKKGRP